MKNKISIFTSIIIFIWLSVQVFAALPEWLFSLSYDLKKCTDLSRSSCSTSIYNNDTTFSMNSEGVYDLIVSATDNAGYSETETFTYYIDKTSPSSVWISWISATWTQSDTVNISCSDSLSGCDTLSYQYRVMSSNIWCTASWTWITGTSYTTSTANQYICARAKDTVWNGYSYSSPYHIDKVDSVDPTYTISYTPNLTLWNNTSTRVDITCSDTLSGCNMYDISGWTIVWNTYSQTFTSNTSWNIELRDNSSLYNSTTVNYDITNIDKNIPTVDIDFWTYTSPNWTKNNVNASVTCNDTVTPISWCKSSTYQIREELSWFTCNSGWWTRLWPTRSINTWIWTNKIRYICARAQDDAWNYGYSAVYIVNIDKNTPSYWDISSISPINNSKLQADTHIVTASALRAWWSPITLIEWYFEDFSTPSSYEIVERISTSDLNSTNAEELQISANMTNVDIQRSASGYREYSFKITKVEDAAGNIKTDSLPWNLPIFTYRVFANSSNIATKNIIVNELDIWNIADATNNDLSIELKDIYGNVIVPASDINRRINFYFDVDNNLRLDQFQWIWDAIVVKRPNSISGNLLTNSTIFINEPSNNWIYTYWFEIYSPTYSSIANDGRQWVNGSMIIHDIDYSISEDPYTFINNNWSISYSWVIIFDGWKTDIDFNFRPLYTAEYRWDLSLEILSDTIQEEKLLVSKASGTSASAINSSILLWFWQTDNTGENIEHPNYDFIYKPNDVSPIVAYEWHIRFPDTINNMLNLWNIPISLPSNIVFNAKVRYWWGTVNSSLPTYISSHIKYDLNGKTIIYDAHTIGKNRYVDGTVLSNTSQIWLKVMWRIQSKNQSDLTTGQSWTDLFAIWNNTKSWLKEIIQKQTTLITKNISWETSWFVNNLTGNSWLNITWTRLKNNTVLYYDLTNEVNKNLQIWNGSDLIAEWVKTIIVKWWNIYMKNNITYWDKSNDMLWVISIKDDSWNGWNIYLDTEVTHLVGMYYSDKAIVSYDGTNEIDWSIGLNLLKNQFYLYGTLFSENTIWWTVIQKCPYYITDTCDIDTAKKYDLNFLRRYFVYDADADWDKDDVYNSGTGYFTYPDPNFQYPVIIDYNPNVQLNIPPLFGSEQF